MKRTTAILFLVFFFHLPVNQYAGAELTILTEDLPPFNYTENGKLTGATTMVVQEIIRRLGIVDSIEVVQGYPADEILEKADELNCDVIFMGTHGKGFLKHSYFGSAAKKVLRRTRKPVFIVPLPEGKTDITIPD